MKGAYKIRSKVLDNFLIDLLEEGRKDKFMRLTPSEARMVQKPNFFAEKATLDQKLTIAQKLGKRIYVIITNEDADINAHEFAKIFRYTFFSEERNDEAIEFIDEKGVVVFGSESISRWLQRTEMFLNSDLYEITKAIKRLKGKKVVANFGFQNSQHELKDLFMHTMMRMFFACLKWKTFLKFYAINEKEFSILCIIWLSARPMSNEGLRAKLENIGDVKVADVRSSLKHLALKKYIHGVSKEATHVKGRASLWMLTDAGYECINAFIKKVSQDTITNIYE